MTNTNETPSSAIPIKPVVMCSDITALKLPSIFKGDIAFLTFIVTDDGGNPKEVGKLWGTGGVLSFDGDADASAKVFFDNVIELNRARLDT